MPLTLPPRFQTLLWIIAVNTVIAASAGKNAVNHAIAPAAGPASRTVLGLPWRYTRVEVATGDLPGFFAGLDERYDENTSGSLGVGTLILTNWETNAKLGIGFEVLRPLAPC